MRYITIVLSGRPQNTSNIAGGASDILDIRVLNYETAEDGSYTENRESVPEPDLTQARMPRSGESDKVAMHRCAQAFYWLRTGLHWHFHMRVWPERMIGYRWIGYNLETFIAKQRNESLPLETEVLIIGWHSAKQRHDFMTIPDGRGTTWETGFERPLLQSGILPSSERWTLTQHFYLGPSQPPPPQPSKMKRIWQRLTSLAHV